MKEKFKTFVARLFKNQLVKGSAVLFSGNMLANLANYLYHLLMGRLLGPADYGALESVISLLYFLGIPLATINLFVVKTVSGFRGRGQEGKAVSFYRLLSQKVFWFGLFGGILFFSFSPLIQNFLHLDSAGPILAILGYSFVAIFIGINTSVLTASLKFSQTSFINVLVAGGKLVFALLLTSLGWAIFGASFAFLLGSFLGFVFSRSFLWKVLKKDSPVDKNFRLSRKMKETVPFLILTLAFTSLYTTDIVLARHFLPPEEAGFYAALAVLGKIIFFASGPITGVMFPLISGRHAAGENYKKLFLLSLGLVFLVCAAANAVYFLFPGLMVRLLFGAEYLAAAKNLVIFSLFLSFYSLANLASQFFLSISQNKIVILPFLAALAQAVLIIFFHQSLVQIALISTLACGLLFASLMIYFLKREVSYESS
jgi:O-antigen/teichoic acid export membrane protein